MTNIDLGGTVMDAYIKKIYDMLYSPIISPYNLLENEGTIEKKNVIFSREGAAMSAKEEYYLRKSIFEDVC